MSTPASWMRHGRRAARCTSFLWLLTWFALGGCASLFGGNLEAGEPCAETSECAGDLECNHCSGLCQPADPGNRYVVMDSAEVPVIDAANELTTFGCDLDGDGDVDNVLGALLAYLPTVPGFQGNFDPNAPIADLFAEPEPLHLFHIEELAELSEGFGVDVSHARGRALGPTPSEWFSGSGDFELVEPWQAACGVVRAAGFEAAPLVFPVQLVLAPGLPFVTVDLDGSCIDVETAGVSGWIGGMIGGAIPEQTVESEVLPAVAAGISRLYEDTALAGPIACVADDGGSQDGVAQICAQAQPGAFCSAWDGVTEGVCLLNESFTVVIQGWDADGDGVIVVDELDPVVRLLLAPDLDTDGDGTDDALSFGFGFTAVPAVVNP